MYNDINAAQVLGVSRANLKNQFNNRQITDKSFNALVNAKFNPYVPSGDIEERFAEIARELGATNTYLLVRPNLRRMANDMKRIGLNNQFLFQPGPYIEGFSEGGSVDIDVVEVQSEGLDLENYLLPEIETPPLAAQPMPSQQVINSALTQNNNLMNTGLTQTETALLSEEEKMLRLKQRNLA